DGELLGVVQRVDAAGARFEHVADRGRIGQGPRQDLARREQRVGPCARVDEITDERVDRERRHGATVASSPVVTFEPVAATTVRWGIASTGGIAHGFVSALARLPDAEVVAVASRTAESAHRFAAAHGIPRRHASYEAMAADDAIDVVYVGTPHSRH